MSDSVVGGCRDWGCPWLVDAVVTAVLGTIVFVIGFGDLRRLADTSAMGTSSRHTRQQRSGAKERRSGTRPLVTP